MKDKKNKQDFGNLKEISFMKKITIMLTVFALAMIILLTGCSKADDQAQSSAKTSYSFSEKDEYSLSLAQKAESYAQVFEILKANDSEEFQIALAKLDNNIVQEALLNYENLSTNALIVICENPKSPNIEQYAIKSYFENAICNAELTPEQEVKIAKTNKYPMQMGILCREDLSSEALIYLVESNNTFNYVINLEYFQIRDVVYNQIIRVPLTVEEKEKLGNLDISYVDDALKEKERQEISEMLSQTSQEGNNNGN